MTKKRFVKLLMAKNFSRNEANFYAWILSFKWQIPYIEEIQDPWYEIFSKNSRK